jgi:hypothetical protein
VIFGSTEGVHDGIEVECTDVIGVVNKNCVGLLIGRLDKVGVGSKVERETSESSGAIDGFWED